MADIFSKDATSAQLKKLPELPAERGGIGIVATTNDVGMKGEINKDIGKPGGWFVLAEGSWMKRAGGAVAGWIGWNGRSS